MHNQSIQRLFNHLPRYIRLLLVFLAGLSNVLAFAPWNLWPVSLLSPFVLLLVVRASKFDKVPLNKRDRRRRRSRRAATAGFIYGLGWFGAGISWVHVSIASFGGLPLAASLTLIGLLVVYLSLFPTLATYLLARFFRQDQWLFAFPALWFTVEWLRSWLLTGFPWLSLGYSQITSPLASWAPLIGEAGITTLMLLFATGLYVIAAHFKKLKALYLLVGICVATTIVNQLNWVTKTGDSTSVVMVQGNVKQELRWVPENELPTMEMYYRLTEPYLGTDLIIWPEAGIPRIEPMAVEFLDDLDNTLAANGSTLITGIIDYNFESRDIYNSLIVVGRKSAQDNLGHYIYPHSNRYYKHHLLPIGEFVPFEDFLRPLAPIFDLPMSSFSRGDEVQTNLIANGRKLASAICFEIAFPGQIRKNIHPETNFILTVSNDAWFGDSIGPLQHMEIAQMRALEFGRPVLRSTNNGLTGISDERGTLVASIPQFTRQVLQHKVEHVSGTTPFTRIGNAITWLFVICVLVSRVLSWRNQRHIFRR